MMVSVGTTQEDLGFADCNLDLVTVIAPNGKLGIVLDNPNGGMPVVHAVGRTSSLRGKVLVGDMLLSVDEVDCRGMSCRDVSAFIGSRQHAARTLVLARRSVVNRGNATASSVAF
jgi:C-terminal processing protease CtpA/Prc